MPLKWTIDADQRLVTVVANGEVTRAQFDKLLDTLRDVAGSNSYRRLFDGRHGHTLMAPEDLMALGVRMRAEHHKGPMGALAAVVPSEHAEVIARVLGMLATTKRPMRVFRDIGAARRWIMEQVEVPEASPGMLRPRPPFSEVAEC